MKAKTDNQRPGPSTDDLSVHPPIPLSQARNDMSAVRQYTRPFGLR